jgi:hypothetical protein
MYRSNLAPPQGFDGLFVLGRIQAEFPTISPLLARAVMTATAASVRKVIFAHGKPPWIMASASGWAFSAV